MAPDFTFRERQARFDEFRRFNKERLREALAFAKARSFYVASARSYATALAEHEFDDQFLVREVRKDEYSKLEGK